MNTISQRIYEVSKKLKDSNAQIYRDKKGNLVYVKYKDFFDEVKTIGSSLLSLGIKKEDKIGFLSDNRREWLIMDLAIISIRAIDVPRGTDTLPSEMKFILGFADCIACVVENIKERDKILGILDSLDKLKMIIILDSNLSQEEAEKDVGDKVKIVSYQKLLNLGAEFLKNHPDNFLKLLEEGKEDDIITIIFTSGTTGEPKGVMLSHKNFSAQNNSINSKLTLGLEDALICILPIWHSFMRALTYVAMTNLSGVIYSKPMGRVLLKDIADTKPHFIAIVPRVLELFYQNIMSNVKKSSKTSQVLFNFFLNIAYAFQDQKSKLYGFIPEFKKRSRFLDIATSVIPYALLYPLDALGHQLVFKKARALFGEISAGIAGGAATPAYIAKFFKAIKFTLLEGYGLTEASPVISVMTQWNPVEDTVGSPLLNTEVKIVDPDTGELLSYGKKGLLYAKGPQIMKGYYKKPELTQKVIKDGWLDTGDLAMLTFNNEIKIMGRQKDTIVLLGGENIEPSPIENKLNSSMFISVCMVYGSEHKYLVALIIPEKDILYNYINENIPEIKDKSYSEILKDKNVINLYKKEIDQLISMENGFKDFELINNFMICEKPFEVGDELSAKQDLKRNVIIEKYSNVLEALYKR